MKKLRKFNEMTAEEKTQSVKLWKLFYDSQLSEDFQSSWKYWKERLEYLENIGIDHDKSFLINKDLGYR
jgi:hypothetical protein